MKCKLHAKPLRAAENKCKIHSYSKTGGRLAQHRERRLASRQATVGKFQRSLQKRVRRTDRAKRSELLTTRLAKCESKLNYQARAAHFPANFTARRAERAGCKSGTKAAHPHTTMLVTRISCGASCLHGSDDNLVGF